MHFRDFNNKIKEYKNDKVKPVIETTLNMFKVTFPNMNYKFDDQEIDQETDQESIQRMIIEVIKNEPTITRNGMAKKLNISSTKIKHYLGKMRNSGLIVHKGSTKAGHWEIVD